MTFRKAIKFVVACFFVVISAIFGAEVYFRYGCSSEECQSKVDLTLYYMKRNYRVYKMWLQENQKSPFQPPFTVYANKDFSDPERLELIRQNTRTLKNVDFEDVDFLKLEAQWPATKYKIHFNKDGFRNLKDYQTEKPANTHRIITYGSYIAFGHGVDTDKTFSSLLENLLNKVNPQKHYEVFNAGQHAGSAVVALAHLDEDISRYKPDTIILDYGFVDDLIFDDYSMPLAFKFRSWLVRNTIKILPEYVFLNSMVLANLVRMHYTYFQDRRANDFTNTLKKITEICEKNKIQVIIVRQLAALIGNQRFLPAIRDPENQIYIDVDKVFERIYSKYENDDSLNGNITGVVNKVTQERAHSREFKYPKLKLNVWHLNALGHFELASYMSEYILDKESFLKNQNAIKMQDK